MKKFLCICLSILFLLGISATASAADMGNKDKNIALTVVYQDAGNAVAGAPVQLYKIASMDSSFKITADPTFAEFKSAIENEDTQWYILADSLRDFILDKNISCDDATTINTSGVALFPTGSKTLNPGVYLLYCPKHTYNGKIYYASPVIISLPNYRSDGQLSNYVTANIKFSSMDDHPMDVTVKKVWDHKGYPNKQPEKITVELFKDGTAVAGQSKELSAANNWTYTWTNLDPAKYDVKEKEVTGYKETGHNSEEKEDNHTTVITITNTYQPNQPPSGNHGGGKPPQKLPQTGQLTWPIPVLTVAGMVLFALGWWLCFDNRKGSR